METINMECNKVRSVLQTTFGRIPHRWWWPWSTKNEKHIIALCLDHFERCPYCIAERDAGIAAIGGEEALERILLDPEKRDLLRTEEGRKQLAAEASR